MKKLVSLVMAFTLALSLAACGTPTPAPNPEDTTTPSTNSDVNLEEKEAPQLKTLVDEGKLPALAERLPVAADIMIEPDVVELGSYGGSLSLTTNDSGRWTWGNWTEQSLVRFKQDGSGKVEPNIAKSLTSNDDATVWTIKLREGMKWSDGAPLTADDLIFYYDHMSTPALNADRTAVSSEDKNFYSVYTSKSYNCYQTEVDGKKYWAQYAKVNDYEVTVTFKAPKPSFAEDLAVDNKWGVLPKHFYKNYVARKDGVSDDATFPLITEEVALANANKDFAKQWDSYGTMSKSIGYYHWDYYIVPQLRSFIATKDNHNTVGETFELVRNPYFFKTDSAGRQLPYLDSLKVKIINEQDQITLQAMSGEFDIYDATLDYSVVAKEIQATHTLHPQAKTDWSTEEGLMLNQTVKDLDKRALFQDKRFREALSICVDRDLLNETLKNGMSAPWQASINEGAYGHDPEWSAKWTEFDVTKANALLDEVTEPWDKKAGTFRKMKGTTKNVEIIVSIADPSKSGDFIALLQSAAKEIGVNIVQKVDADYRKTLLSNDVEACVELTGATSPAIRPDSIVPVRNVAVWYSAYGKWYEDGKTEANGGIAPTGDILKLVEAYDAILTAAGDNREEIVSENVQKIYDLHKENIWIIGYLQPQQMKLLVSNDIKNVKSDVMIIDEFRFNSMLRPEQYWRSK